MHRNLFAVEVLRELYHSFRFLGLQWVGKLPSQKLRQKIYRSYFRMDIGEATVIYNSCHIRAPEKIRIGAYSSIGDQAVLDGRSGLEIGDSVNISSGAFMY